MLRQAPGGGRARARQLPERGELARARAARCRSTGEVVDSPGAGQRYELRARRASRSSGRRRRRLPAPEEGPHVRVPARRSPTCGRAPTPSAPSPASATRVASRSTSSSRSRASSTSTRRSSRPATARAPAQMFRVTTLDLGKLPRDADGRDRLHAGLLRPAGVPDRQRPARGRDLRLRARQGLHLRPDVPRRELEHVAAPGRVLDDRAGDGVLRPRPTTWTWPRRSSSASSATCSSSCAEDMKFFDERIDEDASIATLEASSTTPFVRLPYTEAVGRSSRSRARRSSSRCSGATTCRPSTSAT